EYMFGKPSRITTSISLGQSGVINIEREAELSGKIHDKGIAILTGYLRKLFAQDKPLAFSASICFEQSYGGVDGDSASSTELYLLLATLAGVPIRQDLAVTGSVNQHGEIQPIGGVNEKIEGFYDVCLSRKLTGTQGVIIPHQNVLDLQLRTDVVDAVAKGVFHIYPVKTIEDGLELLTGFKAGNRQSNGNWEKNTMMHRIDQRLHELALGIETFYADHKKNGESPVKRPSKRPPCPPEDPRRPTRKKDEEDE
ncbi:ATP-dependent protease, partial [bacterium]|nr:ATP-dependent protease [candidate division CSSED10-310 bacterium]